MQHDYWENEMVFVTGGKKFCLNENCRTICKGLVDEPPKPIEQPIQIKPVAVTKPISDKVVTPQLSVTKCIVCNSEIPGKRQDRKFCSPRCRQVASRKNRQLELMKV